MSKPELTVERLRELLKYDIETGIFTWRVNRPGHVKAGDVAGANRYDGYTQIRVDGRVYYAHRLAWFYVYETWPTYEIDHINGVTSDARLCNLREATRAQNQHNQGARARNKSGYKGVSWHKGTRKWQAQIRLDGRTKPLGVYDTPELAHAVYCEAARKHHGDFARTSSHH